MLAVAECDSQQLLNVFMGKLAYKLPTSVLQFVAAELTTQGVFWGYCEPVCQNNWDLMPISGRVICSLYKQIAEVT